MTNPIEYNPNIPKRNDTIGKSQIDFLNNFGTLYTAFAANHVPLDALSGAGNHTFVQFPEQSAQFQTNVGEISVYAKDVEGQTDQIFLKYQGSTQEFRFTNYQIYSLLPTPTQTSFFTFLPGNVIMYFGIFTAHFTGFPPLAVLQLLPAIAKRIVTINLCPAGVANNNFGYIPNVTLQQEENGIFTKINVNNSGNNVSAMTLLYVVLANI